MENNLGQRQKLNLSSRRVQIRWKMLKNPTHLPGPSLADGVPVALHPFFPETERILPF